MAEKAVLVGVNLQNDGFDVEMEELQLLCEACNIEVVDTVTQNLLQINPKTYVGTGKIEEIKIAINNHDADVVVFNDELSPAQITNLEKLLEVTIYDRTFVILEIFKRRAHTKEAILQVEIATLNYLKTRLIGLRKGLSRQAGGAGSGAYNKGLGETKLELDRRNIADEIAKRKRELDNLTSQRAIQRQKRKINNLPIVSLVGYTNSGKSTTLNKLLSYSIAVKKEVYQENMLFATLETSSRLIKLENNHQFVITDTIGFINKLPHHLIEAFKSTLEEITESDLLLHVVDSSNPHYNDQIRITNEVIKEIGVKDIPIIYVFNKIDKLPNFNVPLEYGKAIAISAETGENFNNLINLIESIIFKDEELITYHIPYQQSQLVNLLKESAFVQKLDYENDYITIQAKVSPILKVKLQAYQKK